MKLIIDRQTTALTSLLSIFLLFRFVSVEISSLILIFLTLILAAVNLNFFQKGFNKVFFLLAVTFVATHGLFDVRSLYDVFKDLWYFLNPIFLYLFGFLIAYYVRDRDEVLWLVVLCGLFFSLIYLFDYFNQVSSGVFNYKEIRDEIGKSSYISVIAFSFSLYLYPRAKLFQKIVIIATCIIILISIYFTFSRTMWFIFFCCLLFINFKFLQKDAKSKLYYLFILFFLLLAFIFVVKDTDFYDKVSSTFSEVSSKHHWTLVDINERWRAYESYRAFKVYSNGDLMQTLFGYGAGYLLDLKVLIELGDKGFRYIPVLHNGFAFLLLKSGALGLLCYLLFFYTNIKFSLKIQDEFFKNTIFCMLIILLITTYVISGLYNKSSLSQSIILLGVLTSLSVKGKIHD